MLLLFAIALVFSTSTAFATDNNSNTISSYNTTKNMAAGSAAGSSVSFTSTQINTAASSVNTYINKYKKLPSYVTIGSTKVTMPQFLKLMTQNVINLNSGTAKPVTLTAVNKPTNAAEIVKTGKIYKSEYINMSKTLTRYMNTYHTSPSYINSSLGKLKYETLVFTFSKILTFQKTYKRLPNYITVSAWQGTSSNQGTGTITTSFTSAQITSTASSVNTYKNKYKNLPIYVLIGNTKVTMPQLLKLMTQNVINLNSGTAKPVTLTAVNSPTNATETVQTGKIYKSEYISIARTLVWYMNAYHRAPSYMTTSIGKVKFQNLVYTYSTILNFQKTYNRLPNYVTVKNWNLSTSFDYSLRPVYITCDLISNTIVDTNRNNALAAALQKLGVRAVNYGVKGSVWNLLKDKSVASNALVIEILGGADAAYIREKGSAYYQNWLGNKEMFLVFTDCAKDITDLAWLERAHDDNYSPASFTGLAHPDQYLLSHGLGYFEPLTTTNYDACALAIYKFLLSIK